MPHPDHPDANPVRPVLSPEEKTQALIELRRQMQELHAHLEYLKLMLKVGVKG